MIIFVSRDKYTESKIFYILLREYKNILDSIHPEIIFSTDSAIKSKY